MGTKITVLPQVITPQGSDELPISQDVGGGSRNTYKATLDQLKGYIGSGGSITNIGVNSTDGSIGVFGSPVTSSGTISLTISSVGLDKLDDGGATGGEILTYNGSTSAWEPGFGGSSGIIPNILVGNGGSNYTLTNYTNNTASNYLVFVGGVAQRPTTDFTINGSSIIFDSNVASGVQILVYAVISIASLNLDATPIGTVSWFAASAAPASYLECSGGVVPISDYLDLWYVIGTTYNTGGEGAGNFRLPNLRGEFIRGWDNGRGVDIGRTFGSWQKGTLYVYDVNNDGIWTTSTKSGEVSVSSLTSVGVDNYNLSDYPNVIGTGVNATESGNLPYGSNDINQLRSGTTRPRNVALLPCIKALKTVTGNVNTLNFIEKPASPTNGQVLTYNGSTSTWVASSLSAMISTNILTVSEPAIKLGGKGWGHYNGSYYTKNQFYFFGNNYISSTNNEYANPPRRAIFLENYLLKNPNLTIKKSFDSLLYVIILLSDGTLWASGNIYDIQNIYTIPNGYSCMFLKLNSMFSNKTVEDFSFSSSSDDLITLGILCSDGSAYAWGYNGHGQIGNGNTTASNTPVPISVAGKTISQISVAGYSGTHGNILLKMTDGTLYACGYNAHGQLGVGNTTGTTTFTQCKQNSTTFVTNVSAICESGKMQGGYTRYIIKNDGTLWGTGLNSTHQLADGTTTNSNYYKQVNGISNVRKVVTSGWDAYTAVAILDSTGSIYTWGYSGHGATGQGSATNITTPIKVSVYQNTPTSTLSLPTIVDIIGTDGSNSGAIGLISSSKQLFTAGCQIFPPLTILLSNSYNTDLNYRFELAALENVEEAVFYTNQLTSGQGASVGTIVRDSGGIIWVWGYNAAFITPSDRITHTPSRVNY